MLNIELSYKYLKEFYQLENNNKNKYKLFRIIFLNAENNYKIIYN